MTVEKAKLQVKTELGDFNEGKTIEIDKTSALPSSLIQHILSLVPTVNVAG